MFALLSYSSLYEGFKRLRNTHSHNLQKIQRPSVGIGFQLMIAKLLWFSLVQSVLAFSMGLPEAHEKRMEVWDRKYYHPHNWFELPFFAVNFCVDVRSPYKKFAKRRKSKKDKESLMKNECVCLNLRDMITIWCDERRLGKRGTRLRSDDGDWERGSTRVKLCWLAVFV